jgi:hypothetical protein
MLIYFQALVPRSALGHWCRCLSRSCWTWISVCSGNAKKIWALIIRILLPYQHILWLIRIHVLFVDFWVTMQFKSYCFDDSFCKHAIANFTQLKNVLIFMIPVGLWMTMSFCRSRQEPLLISHVFEICKLLAPHPSFGCTECPFQCDRWMQRT